MRGNLGEKEKQSLGNVAWVVRAGNKQQLLAPLYDYRVMATSKRPDHLMAEETCCMTDVRSPVLVCCRCPAS